MTFPTIVSPDDHLCEPPDLWTSRLASKYLAEGPRVVRERGGLLPGAHGPTATTYVQSDDMPEIDVWHFEDTRTTIGQTVAAVGYPRDAISDRLISYDDMRKGCYDRDARIADMDVAGIEASICFPNTFVRFCGQRFLWAKDKDLGAACVTAYNDFILDEWCGPSNGRLIPCGIVPLWDPELAAAEVRRCAAKGMKALTFSENPVQLDLPSIYTDHWDPMFQACQDNGIVVCEHVGSSSKLPNTAPEAPLAVVHVTPALNSAMAMIDWLFAGMPIRFPDLKLCLSECQIGWIPYVLGRIDRLWEFNGSYTGIREVMDNPPSTYFTSNIYVTFFEDRFGVSVIDQIGVDNVMFETDYPHGDSTWPDCQTVAEQETQGLSPEDVEKVVRGNARRLFNLD